MKTGSIKWFSPSKGYGFITNDAGEDLFLHYSGLVPGQDRRLFPGDRVEFDEVGGEKGRKATSVRCVSRVRDETQPDADGGAEVTEQPPRATEDAPDTPEVGNA